MNMPPTFEGWGVVNSSLSLDSIVREDDEEESEEKEDPPPDDWVS